MNNFESMFDQASSSGAATAHQNQLLNLAARWHCSHMSGNQATPNCISLAL
jgi:hypothetical protein